MSSQLSKTTRLRLRVTAAAEKQLRAGHPWVYSDSVREQNRTGVAGELAVIFDRRDKFLAVGMFDPESPIRVRVLQTGKPLAIDPAFWQARLNAAVEYRGPWFGAETNGYRLINGESDGWPGLVLDRYATTLVLKIYTAAWLPWLDTIETLLRDCFRKHTIVFRCSRNIEVTALQSGKRFRLPNTPSPPVVFLENGIRFEADVWRGQKTGFFLDQRENRQLVGSLARGRTVLNAFSFSGGFSLYAARGGASSVTDLDISKHALESAQRVFALNQSNAAIADSTHESIQADAFEWLVENTNRRFDLIVLDPPSLARREAERAGAIRAYYSLVESSLKLLRPRGILVACSCSAHVSTDEFFTAVRQAARNSGRRFTALQTTRHAVDHRATFREAQYLKAIFLRC